MKNLNLHLFWCRGFSFLCGIMVLGHACTGRKAEERKVPDLPPRQEPLDRNRPEGGAGRGKIAVPQEASAVIAISEEDLKKAAPKETLNLSGLEYKVTYQDTVIGPAPINFKNGTALITLNDLPANQIGDLKVEVIAADKVQFAATLPDVSLPPEKVSALDVNLASTGSSSGSTPGGGSGPGTGTGVSPGASPPTGTGVSPGASPPTGTGVSPGASPPTGTQVNPGTSQRTGTSVSPSTWDGKSDKGNNLWNIKPL